MPTSRQKWDACDYAKNSSAQLQWAQELIAKLSLCGSESLLDIGCGDGKITAQISQLLGEGSALGIDLSQDMISLASRQFSAASHPNLSFLQLDATKILLPAKFDVAFSNAALHWVADHLAVLHGVRASLKPKGKFLFQMGGRGNAVEVFQVIHEVIDRNGWQRHYQGFIPPYYFYGPEEYEAWLPQCGFHLSRAELIPKDMQHEGKEGLKGWLRTTWFPYTDRLPSELRDAFLDEVVDGYLSAYPTDAQGWSHVRMMRIEVEGVAL